MLRASVFKLLFCCRSTGKNLSTGQQDLEFNKQQSVIKDGWSLLTALHTVLLPDKVRCSVNAKYQPPMVEILARRWQDRCQEVQSLF